MLAPRDSDDVQSLGTSFSGDSRHIGEDRCLHGRAIRRDLMPASTLDQAHRLKATGN
ncbi:hypothetical protein ARMGADRAFT_1079687 [Armillaria gallica]|uniref:Uncharacterized protein n=1 Tax=Armillaria gallica TaxID=47427 RepID=A0A2H3DHN7_ARMGA|nr:hypothetical protein ARMGADRAFT_1079687 [Armillaria gallica]